MFSVGLVTLEQVLPVSTSLSLSERSPNTEDCVLIRNDTDARARVICDDRLLTDVRIGLLEASVRLHRLSKNGLSRNNYTSLLSWTEMTRKDHMLLLRGSRS